MKVRSFSGILASVIGYDNGPMTAERRKCKVTGGNAPAKDDISRFTDAAEHTSKALCDCHEWDFIRGSALTHAET